MRGDSAQEADFSRRVAHAARVLHEERIREYEQLPLKVGGTFIVAIDHQASSLTIDTVRHQPELCRFFHYCNWRWWPARLDPAYDP